MLCMSCTVERSVLVTQSELLRVGRIQSMSRRHKQKELLSSHVVRFCHFAIYRVRGCIIVSVFVNACLTLRLAPDSLSSGFANCLDSLNSN